MSADNTTVILSGYNLQIINGQGDTSICNGLGNLIIGYNDLGNSLIVNGSARDIRTGSHNLIVGDQNNYTSYGGVVFGTGNEIDGSYAAVTGGGSNLAGGFNSSVTGGLNNVVGGNWAAIAGGFTNIISGNGSLASILGGNSNTVTNSYATISGGEINLANGFGSSISGGNNCVADGKDSSVSGGSSIGMAADLGWAAGSQGAGLFSGLFSSP
jgi:hypothetical protein